MWLSTSNLVAAEQLASLDFGYVCVDLQHGLVDYNDAVALLQVIRHGDGVPICRSPWNEPGIIGKLLDAGAMGIIIPMVNTAEQCRQAVSACLYAPAGARSFGPTRAAAVLGENYASEANEQVACIPMIETVEALDNLDEILDVEGVDAIYVGPADLSISLGLPPGSDNADASFQSALAKILDACAKRGIPAGIHSTPSLSARRLEQGFQMVTVTTDLQATMSGAVRSLAQVSSSERSETSEKMY